MIFFVISYFRDFVIKDLFLFRFIRAGNNFLLLSRFKFCNNGLYLTLHKIGTFLSFLGCH